MMKEKSYYNIIISIMSEGESKEDALKNIKEAVGLYLEPVDDDLAISEKSEITELVL